LYYRKAILLEDAPNKLTMTNAQINTNFLLSLDDKTCNSILENIANHYGITVDEVMDEVTESPKAENVMDYVTVDRPAVSLYYRMWARSQRIAA